MAGKNLRNGEILSIKYINPAKQVKLGTKNLASKVPIYPLSRKKTEKIFVQAKSGWKAKEEGGIIAISMDKEKTKQTEQMTISVVKRCLVYPSCYLAKALISSDKDSVGLPVLVYGWNLNFPPHQSLTNTLSVIIIRK